MVSESNFDETWLCRSFEEFDEKLPMVAKSVILRDIDYHTLDEDQEPVDEDDLQYKQEVFNSIFAILRETVECTSEMTAEELDAAMTSVLTACHLVQMVEDGFLDEDENGSYSLSEKGREYYDAANELGIFEEELKD